MRRNAPSPCPQPGFLTRRIDYFRALAPSLAFTRKSESLGFQIHRCDALPQGRHGCGISPLYGTNRPYFSVGNRPWMGNSIPWIGESMGWRWISMGWIGRGAAWMHKKAPRISISNAKTRPSVAVRFNAVPYSAQGFAAGCAGAWRGGRRGRGAACGAKKWGFRLALPARCTNFVWQKPRPAQ